MNRRVNGSTIGFGLAGVAFLVWLAATVRDPTSTAHLLEIAARDSNPTHDRLARLYERLPDTVKDRLPFHVQDWDTVWSDAVDQLAERSVDSAILEDSEVIVPPLLSCLRSGRFQDDKLERLIRVLEGHPSAADQSIPALLGIGSTNRLALEMMLLPLARLGPEDPRVFACLSNELFSTFLVNSDLNAHLGGFWDLNGKRNKMGLAFSMLTGHEVERSNLLQRLLREVDDTSRASLQRCYARYHFPTEEQAWVLERLSRDPVESIKVGAIEGLAVNRWRSETSRATASHRIRQILYDDTESPSIRGWAAWWALRSEGEVDAFVPAITHWLLEEEDFGLSGFGIVTDQLTKRGISIPGFGERCRETMFDPNIAWAHRHCLAYWYCTLDTATTLSRLAELLKITTGDEQQETARAITQILLWTRLDAGSSTPTNQVAAFRARRQAVLSFRADQPRFDRFRESVKQTLDKENRERRRVLGGGLYELVGANR